MFAGIKGKTPVEYLEKITLIIQQTIYPLPHPIVFYIRPTETPTGYYIVNIHVYTEPIIAHQFPGNLRSS